MIAGAIGGVFLREVPEHLLRGYLAGNYRIFGSTIRSVADGRIAGFLQEAAPLAFQLANPVSAALAPLGIAADVGQLVQGELLRAGINRLEAGVSMLQTLGVANLTISTAGLGVAVANFAIMSARIEAVRRAIGEVAEQIATLSDKIDRIHQEGIDLEFVEIQALARSSDEAWLLTDAAAQTRWQDVAKAALHHQARFELRADRMLGGDVRRYDLADPFLDGLALTAAIRVSALIASNETLAARAAAADGARSLERITGGIGLADLSRVERLKTSPPAGSRQWALAQASANEAVRDKVRKIRHREATALTRAAPLSELEHRGIKPRDWLAEVRAEEHSSFLFMLPQN